MPLLFSPCRYPANEVSSLRRVDTMITDIECDLGNRIITFDTSNINHPEFRVFNLFRADPDREQEEQLHGVYCWRGVWEGRLYFTDDEYWGSDIMELAKIYTEHIVPACQAWLREHDDGNYIPEDAGPEV